MSTKIKITTCSSELNFRKPLEHGWKREVVYPVNKYKKPQIFYISPGGKRLRTKNEIEQNLEEGLDVGMFSFSKQPLGVDQEFVRDASAKGYRKAVICNESILDQLIPISKAPTNNDLVEDSIADCSISECVNELEIDKHIEKYAQMDVEELRQMIIRKDDVIDDLRNCLVRNETEIKHFQKKIKTKTELSNEELQNLIKIMLPMLTENQIKIMTSQKKRVNWTCDEISIGFALSFFSRRGYAYLIYKLQYPLPAIRTLQLWSQNMNIAPGILKDSFVVLKAMRNSLTDGESQVILSFDEMKCKSRYEYNKTLDCVMGPHSQMQTAMVRGLFSKFKQPLYVDFDKKMTKDLLNLLIEKLHKNGYNVVGIVNDNGGGNVGLWTNCNVDFENNFILHPETGEKIYMFSDAPHLLKLLRNWFIDGGFQIFQKGILMAINSVKALQREMNEKFGFKYLLTHRVNQDCLENFFSQMRGRNGPNDHPTAVECLYTVKSIILGKNPGLSVTLHSNTIERDPEEYVSATFMKHLSRDNVTSGVCEQSDMYLPDNVVYLENCDVSKEVQENDLVEEFLEDYSNDFLETCVHLEMAPLQENFDDFPNDNPVNEECRYSTGTCVHLEIEPLGDASDDYWNEITQEFLNDLSIDMTVDEVAVRKKRSEEDGLEYIAGWIAWKFKKAHPEFSKSRRESLPSHITDHTYTERIGINSTSWIDTISYGGLTKPTNEVLQWVRNMESVFQRIHGNEFSDRMNVKKRLIEEIEAECLEVPKQVINLFARSRIYMRCKYLNKQREENALLQRIAKRKAEKHKLLTRDALDDATRAKNKKMRKIVL